MTCGLGDELGRHVYWLRRVQQKAPIIEISLDGCNSRSHCVSETANCAESWQPQRSARLCRSRLRCCRHLLPLGLAEGSRVAILLRAFTNVQYFQGRLEVGDFRCHSSVEVVLPGSASFCWQATALLLSERCRLRRASCPCSSWRTNASGSEFFGCLCKLPAKPVPSSNRRDCSRPTVRKADSAPNPTETAWCAFQCRMRPPLQPYISGGD